MIIPPNFLYNSTIAIEKATQTVTKGNVVITYSGVSGIAARAVQASADEVAKYGKSAAEVGYRFHIDPSNALDNNDQVTFSGEAYEVVGINPHHSMSVYQTVTCFKVLDN